MSCSIYRNRKRETMQIDQHILIRYFLKQASEEEKEVIRQWIESSEDNAGVLSGSGFVLMLPFW